MAKMKPIKVEIVKHGYDIPPVGKNVWYTATVFLRGIGYWQQMKRSRPTRALLELWPWLEKWLRPDLEIGWHFKPKTLSAGLYLPPTVGEGPPRKEK